LKISVCILFSFFYYKYYFYLVRTTITEQKAIQFEDYSIIEPSIILTMNRYSYTTVTLMYDRLFQ
jgi:hypothetical protein